tara:strand:+ start:1143 stop:1292 length:150 start_codon:yes stop_codon:yes gene_type:complete
MFTVALLLSLLSVARPAPELSDQAGIWEKSYGMSQGSTSGIITIAEEAD